VPTSVRLSVIGVVAALAVGIGLAVSGFLVSQRAVGGGAAYVPADAPFFVELRLEPSESQDAALRELLGHFPPIEAIDLEQPLYGQLGPWVDDMLASEGADVSWSSDVAPWFDGRVAVAMTAVPVEALAVPLEPSGAPLMPPFVVLLGVTDRAAADAAIARILAEAGDDAPTFSETQHRGVTIRSAGDSEGGAYALTDDQLLLAADAGGIQAALDAHAEGSGTMAEMEEITRLTEQLPVDWLAFVTYDMTEMLAAAMAEADAQSPGMSEAIGSLLEHQSLRGAMALTAAGDRLALDVAADPASGPFAVSNAERGLAEHVPGDALYYAEGGTIGSSLAAIITPMKDALAEMPEGDEQVETIEAALGAELEELVSWIDDGAITVGYEGGEVYGGVLLVPNDADAARRRLAQLATFAGLGGMGEWSGISVDQEDVAGVTVTTIRWEDPDADVKAFALPAPTGIAVEYAVTEDDLVVIGLGDRFVRRSLELHATDALASQPRFTEAVADLGGPDAVGLTWLDVAGTRTAVEGTVGPFLDDAYDAEIRPWLLPIDRIVTVARLEGDVLVQRSALLVE
jgi:Protein of unknown function (DUF3352)